MPMQFKQTLARLIFILCPVFAISQSTYLPQGSKENILLERLEILGQKDSILNFSKTRPFNRFQVVRGAMGFKHNHPGVSLSKTDEYNLQRLYLNNIEYLPDSQRNAIKSKKPIGPFYKTPANLYEVHVKDFDLIINPIIQFQYMKESDNDEGLFLNSRGVAIRGRIANKIGFAFYCVTL